MDLERSFARIPSILRRMFIGLMSGVLVGAVCALLARAIYAVTDVRLAHPEAFYFLPLGGILAVFVYHVWKDGEDRGPAHILENIQDGRHLPLYKIPEVFAATVLSHLFGASTGRTGAALQIGGNLVYNLVRLLKMDFYERKIATMSGMSAAFSVMFSSPLAGTFFGMEVTSIGHFYYPALVPCMISAVLAQKIAELLGVLPVAVPLSGLPDTDFKTIALAVIIALLAALLASVYCHLVDLASAIRRRFADHPYLRTVICSAVLLALYLLLANETSGGDYYHGAGLDLIASIVDGRLPSYAFLLKMLFTSLSVAAGFKGGEIGPGLFSAASFGVLCGGVFSLSPALSAGISMSAMMAGITNCPVTALFFSLSMFGSEGAVFWLIGAAVGFVFSSPRSIYPGQVILDPQ